MTRQYTDRVWEQQDEESLDRRHSNKQTGRWRKLHNEDINNLQPSANFIKIGKAAIVTGRQSHRSVEALKLSCFRQ
jgi:hypothetical protein